MAMMKKFSLLLLFFTACTTHSKEFRLLYDLYHDYGDFFDDPKRDNGFWNKLKKALAQKGYHASSAKYSLKTLHESEGADALVFFNMPVSLTPGKLRSFKEANVCVFLFEPPATSPHQYQPQRWDMFDTVYTWNDEVMNHPRTKKFHWMQYGLSQDQAKTLPQKPFHEKKLCTLISSNRHSDHPQALFNKRLEVIDFFESLSNSGFDLYGRTCPGNRTKLYKGPVDSKYTTMQDYRFYLCIENMDGPAGHITEKIFDCFYAGCVPIYLGAPNIAKYIPEGCFINMRNFKTNQEVYDFISNISAQDYTQYIKNIEQFLDSKKAYLFSQEGMIDTYLSCLCKED